MNPRERNGSNLFSRATVALLLAGGAPPARAQGLDPVSDDFERHSLGPNWTKYGGSSADIVNDSDLGLPTVGFCAVGWTATAFRANQFCEAEVSLDVDPDMLFQVYGRRRPSDLARYGFHWNGDLGMSRWEIKYDGVPSSQTAILASVVGPGPQPGDRLRIEIFGADPVVIRGFHGGALKLAATDGSPQRIATAGVNGVIARMKQGFVNTPPTPIFENWWGGSLRFVDLGGGIPGIAGTPSLTGSGTLAAGTVATFALTGGVPGGEAILVLGATAANTPLLGGTLVPTPSAIAFGVPLDTTGGFSLQVVWPAAWASNFDLYAQFWIPDPAAVQGLSASNGLLITTS